MPSFDAQGELLKMDVAQPSAMAVTLKAMLEMELPIEKVLPLMTSNVAGLLKFHHKGRIKTGLDADLLVLNENHGIDSVMANAPGISGRVSN